MPAIAGVGVLLSLKVWLLNYKNKFLAAALLAVHQVLTILVKGDTVDVNVAASQRMSPAAWSAAADIFRQELPGVQMLTQEQVQIQSHCA